MSVRLFAAVLIGSFFASWLGGQQNKQELPTTPLSEIPIAVKGGEIGAILRKWYANGTAAGNMGDYYDNRDGGHSLLNRAPYPQLQKIDYTEEQVKTRQNWGLQRRILPYVVFGNSSTAASPREGGSNVRTYYANPGGLAFLFMQYTHNNLYIYPAHHDYDPGHNGMGGYGDLFPTNTPYLIASQGSSGTDQPFMRALPYVLAAFQPEVKKKLIETGLLMPTIQMIMRITNRHLVSSRDYLTGKAHPTAFDEGDVNAQGMVEMAHGITLSNIPPIALIRAVKENTPVNGIDYFEPEHTETLADTPAVMARIFRGSNNLRKIVVSAEDSRDVNNRPLKFYWAVLRGDPNRIKIEYRNPSRSVAEITIPYQERMPIAENSPLESNRIDIAIFVHNGTYYSPPAFVTFYTLDNEARAYGSDGQLLEIAYGVGTSTVWVADWNAFFNVLASHSESWPGAFLRNKFTPEEIAALTKSADEFQKVHATLLAAQEMQAKANAAQKEAGDALKTKEQGAAEVLAAQKAVREAQMSEKRLLEKKMPSFSLSAPDLVKKTLRSLLHDPTLWDINSKAIERLRESAGKGALEAFSQIQKTLTLFGVAENPDGASFHLNPIIKDNTPLTERLTRYEQGMVERLNAIVLSQIIFPGIVGSEWRENYVDDRIASTKNWRDVYRYSPDGTPVGWRRFQSDGVMEFNAEGLLILEKDSQGRCIRARVVRYELEPQKRDTQGRVIEPFGRKLKMIPTDTFREYQYEGVNDWKGHAKLQ